MKCINSQDNEKFNEYFNQYCTNFNINDTEIQLLSQIKKKINEENSLC